MATRRRIGVSIATSEAARRQLMQPVPCWEKVWVVPDNAPAGTTLKVYRWVKTDKVQVCACKFLLERHPHAELSTSSNSVTTRAV